MRIVFMGTPQFALPALKQLCQGSQEVVAVVTRPDRPSGRGKKISAPPIKLLAQELGLPVLQPARLNDEEFVKNIRGFNPDLLVATAYGAYIPGEILEIAPQGAINLHPSLLPRYRGAAPVAWALINGDKFTGVSVHYLVETVDAGDILGSRRIEIAPDDDRPALEKKLFEQGAELLLEVVESFNYGRPPAKPQDPAGIVRAPRLSKDEGIIDWTLSSDQIVNRVRGLNPWPGTFSQIPLECRYLPIRILKAASLEMQTGVPGQVMDAEGKLVIKAGTGAVEIIVLQAPGKKAMDSASFLRGRGVKLQGMMR